VVGVVALVATVLLLPESPPEPPPAPPASEEFPSPDALQAGQDPQRLQESSRVRRMVPVYPGSTFTPMGLLEANGNKMEMGFFEAKAPITEVVDFYMREFGKRGHRVVQQPADNGGATVNYYDPTLGMLVAITATPKDTGRGEPRTVVFPSVTAAPDGILLKAQVPEGLPSPEGLVNVMRVDDHSSGPAKGSTTMTQVAQGTPALLAAFYRREMGTRGYTVVGSSSSTRVEVLDFERPGKRVSITISPLSDETNTESVISTVVENRPNRKGT